MLIASTIHLKCQIGHGFSGWDIPFLHMNCVLATFFCDSMSLIVYNSNESNVNCDNFVFIQISLILPITNRSNRQIQPTNRFNSEAPGTVVRFNIFLFLHLFRSNFLEISTKIQFFCHCELACGLYVY